MDRLEQQMKFILEVDKLKRIGRQSYLTGDDGRKENDAEHSWHLAMMALLLSEYANEKTDLTKVIAMVLIHDLVEIDAGDTYAYDEAGNETKRARELKAADRIFQILPEDQAEWMRGLWDEFEENETKESHFAHTLDKIHPILLNDATKGRAWKEHGVKLHQILDRNKKTPEGSAVLWDYAEKLLEKNVEKGSIIDG